MTKKLILIVPLALIVLLTGAYLIINYSVKAMVDERMAEFVAGGYYQSLEYESVKLTFNGDIIMENLHVTDTVNNEYILESIQVSDFDYFNEFPHSLNLTAEGLRFPLGIPDFGNTPSTTWNNYLAGVMEDDYLPIVLNYQYTYSPQDNNAMDNAFSIALPGSFLLTTNSAMENISLDELDNIALGPGTSATQYSLSLQDSNILFASIALQDLGLVPALLTVQGEAAGLDPAEYRQQLLAELQTMVLFAPQQLQTLATNVVLNVAKFLEGDLTLNVSINPENGGNVQQLQGEIMGAFYIGNFNRIVEVLNLEIETE